MELEQYLFENASYGNDDYISDAIVLISKHILSNSVLREYKHHEKLMNKTFKKSYVTKGKPYKLPDSVRLAEYGDFEFIYDDDYCFSYNYIKMFENHFVGEIEYSITLTNFADVKKAPLLKLFYENKFIAAIPAKVRKTSDLYKIVTKE